MSDLRRQRFGVALPKHTLGIVLAILIFLFYPTKIYADSTWQLVQRMINCYYYSEAYRMLLRLAKEDPKNPEVHYLLAKCLAWMGYKLRANKEFEICLELDPDGPKAKDCHGQIEAWQQELAEKGPKYALSNVDLWFKDHYDRNEYHSWEDNPSPDWVIKQNEDNANKQIFGVDVHFVSAHLANVPDDSASGAWQRWFLRDFHDLWQKTASTATAYGTADLYIRMQKDGNIQPIIVKCEGNKAFVPTLLTTFALYNNNEHLKEPCEKGCVIKAQLSAGMEPKNTGHWYAFTQEGPSKPHLVTFDATFSKTKGVTDTTTSVVTLPERPEISLSAHPQSRATDQEEISKAKEAIDSARYDDAIDCLWPLGARDIPDACLLIAQTYSNKRYQKYDPRMAAIWWEKAALLGEVEAQYQTGCIYEWSKGSCHGGMPDAVKWYEAGAKNGSAACALKLGILSEFGDGVPCDKAAAIHWYKIAAAHGQEDASKALARLHTDQKKT